MSATGPRLSNPLLANLPPAVSRPAYPHDQTRIGIVHFGPGAFHRAHQAVYVDDLLADDPGWGICAVSLHSRGVRDALQPQDGLYTLVQLAERTALRVIGSISEVLCARDESSAVLARLADPSVRLVTLTITEKGYCVAGDTLDLQHPEIVHDLASPDSPRSAIGYLVAGLRERRRLGLRPYTVLSCDNLAGNGRLLRRAVVDFAQRIDAELAAWIEAKVTFPRSMVDSITPATDDALRERVASALGCVDAWPVQREPYTQWVIEDAFCNDRPAFERAGATLSNDIAGYDRAKLRLLNGPHSTLAYLGSLMQIDTVAEAMREPALAEFIERLMRQDIVPSLDVPSGMDPDSYVAAILERFRNPAIHHRLSQIAWDGSQKLPVRFIGTIADALAGGRGIARLCLPVAAWMHFVCREAKAGSALNDPLAEKLGAVGNAATGGAAHDVAAFLQLGAVFAPLADDARFAQSLREAYVALGNASPSAVKRGLQQAL